MATISEIQVRGNNREIKDAAARQSADKMKENLSNILCDYKIVDGEVVTIYGNFSEQSLGNDKRTNKINTKPGDKWKYHGKAGYQVAAAVFYAGDTVVSYEGTGDEEKTLEFTVPAGADSVAFSSYRASEFYVYLMAESSGSISKLKSDVTNIFGGYRITEGETIQYGKPTPVELAEAKRTDIINTKPGDKWEYYGRGDYQIQAAAYYADGEFQSAEQTDHKTERKTFTVPDGCNGVAFSSYYTADFNVVPKTPMTGVKVTDSYEPDWREKKWCAIGDSITAKYSDEVASVIQYWQYIIDKTGIQFVNCATSGRGYKNADDPERQDAFYQKASVARYPDLADADVITVYGSVNDCFKGYTIGNVTDTSTDTICGCVNTTIDNLYICNPTAVIGIITPCPVPGMAPSNDDCEMAQICSKIVEICRRRGVPCLDLYHQSGFHPWDTDFRNAAYINNDGTHPNDIGHKMMYPHFLEFIKTLI